MYLIYFLIPEVYSLPWFSLNLVVLHSVRSFLDHAYVFGLPFLSSPLEIVCRSKTHTCPRITIVSCLYHTVCCCLTLLVFWLCTIVKACSWIHSPHVSSAPSQNTQPHEDPAAFLKNPGQGSSSIEEYVTQFGELSYRVPSDEVVLK